MATVAGVLLGHLDEHLPERNLLVLSGTEPPGAFQAGCLVHEPLGERGRDEGAGTGLCGG